MLEPQTLLRRLSALMPGPYLNLTRYHGVFANRSRFREKLPPPRPPAVEQPASCHPREDGGPGIRPRRLGWAQLLRRVLDIDALTCARCAAAMTVIAFLTDPKVVTRILDHLELPSSLPVLAPPAVTTESSLIPSYDEVQQDRYEIEFDLGQGARDPP